MYEYKDEILNSRVGNLGASDANIIARVAQTETIPKIYEERLAIAKGLIPPVDKFKTPAMILGDDIEMTIYSSLKDEDERWESNKLIKSKKYSKDALSLIAHVDFFLEDDKSRTIKVVECKATKDSTIETMHNYRNQLFVEFSLAKEYAKTLAGKWKVELWLCHYCTENYNGTFDADNITMKRISFRSSPFDIDKGMTILNNYVSNMDAYYPDDEVDASMLPVQVKEQFDLMTNILLEIKEREMKVEEFKIKLYNFLQQNGIKSIKNDVFSVTRVDPSESISFDYKSFLADFEKKHPVKYKKMLKSFEKRTKRRGYAKVTIK